MKKLLAILVLVIVCGAMVIACLEYVWWGSAGTTSVTINVAAPPEWRRAEPLKGVERSTAEQADFRRVDWLLGLGKIDDAAAMTQECLARYGDDSVTEIMGDLVRAARLARQLDIPWPFVPRGVQSKGSATQLNRRPVNEALLTTNSLDPALSARLARLEQERDELAQQCRVEWKKALKDDPLMARADDPPTEQESYTARIALIWLDKQARVGPAPDQKRQKIYDTYYLFRLAKMLDDPDERIFVRDYVQHLCSNSPHQNPAALPSLIREMRGRFPELAGADLSNFDNLWGAVRTKLPGAEAQLAKDVAGLPTALGWPAGVVQALGSMAEQDIVVSAHTNYVVNCQPPALRAAQERILAVVREIYDLQHPGMRPS